MVGELVSCKSITQPIVSFSLVAEIGWLASEWVIGRLPTCDMFQSRCRDWVVGESSRAGGGFAMPARFSLVAEIGWLARK